MNEGEPAAVAIGLEGLTRAGAGGGLLLEAGGEADALVEEGEVALGARFSFLTRG